MGLGSILGPSAVLFSLTQTRKRRSVICAEGHKLEDKAHLIPHAECMAQLDQSWPRLYAA